jgi:sulfide:quinone oxidoreductase
VLVGQRGPERIQRPLDRLRRRGIEVLIGEITALDPDARRLQVDGSEITGEAVIVSLGAELAPDAVPGLAAAGHNLYTLSGALGARDALEQFHGGRIVVVTAAPAYKCPAAPYEAAMLIESEFRHRQLRDRVQIDFYASEPGPMGVAGPKVSAGVRQMIEQRGIVYHPEHQVSAVDASARQIRFSNEATAASLPTALPWSSASQDWWDPAAGSLSTDTRSRPASPRCSPSET